MVVKLNLKFDAIQLEQGKTYITSNKDSLQIDLFKFYVSNVEIHHSDMSIFKEKCSYHLIDLENLESTKITLNTLSKKEISAITFSIGIDNLSSVSGALDGNFDPTKGMYWS